MKSLLVSPPYWDLLQDHLGSPGAYEPLGLEYVAASAVRAGHECHVYQAGSAETREIAAMVLENRYDIVGISAATPAVPWALRAAAAIKQLPRNVPVVIGGDHASACPEIVRDANIDFAVAGEGEDAFARLLQGLAEGIEPGDVPGLVWKDASEEIVQSNRARIDKPDTLPWPTRSQEILDRCRLHGLAYPAPSAQRAAAQILYSRGCPRQCDFCACNNVFGRGIRYRSADDVVREMRMLQDDYNVDLLYFSDLSFGANRRRVSDLCDLILTGGISLPWYVSSTTTDLDEAIATEMARAGCFKVAMGIESMYPATHELLRPGSTVQDVERSAHFIDRAGMLVRGYYMLGVPGETADTFMKGIERLCAIPVDEVRFAFYTPFPGTRVFEKYAKFSVAKDLSDLGSAKPVLDFPEFSVEEQQECCDWALRRFYCGPEYSERWRNKLRRWPRYEQSYAEFHEFLANRGLEVR